MKTVLIDAVLDKMAELMQPTPSGHYFGAASGWNQLLNWLRGLKE